MANPELSTALRAGLPDRLRSLDGLRGIAALVVLVHHALLTVPALADVYFDGAPEPETGSFAWWMTYTPLHLFWMGTEAVSLFFVLSGLVLVLQVVRSPKFSWQAYYPSRLVRLHGPIAAAVVLGALLTVFVQRYDDPDFSRWVNVVGDRYDAKGFIKDIVVVFGISGVIIPLWSLQWEIIFSLALPAYVWIATRGAQWAWWKIAASLLLILVGALTDQAALWNLPVFAIGGLLAAHWSAVSAVADRIRRHRWAWPAIVAVAVVLASVRWEAIQIGVDEGLARRVNVIAIIGLTLLILAAAFWRPLVGLLESRFAQWAGRVSFSLYLVHEPIVVTTRYLFADWSPWACLAVSVPMSLLVGHLFFSLVEKRFHNLSKSVGRRLAPQA